MNRALTIVLLALQATSCSQERLGPKDILREDLSQRRKARLVAELKARPFSENAEPTLDVLVQAAGHLCRPSQQRTNHSALKLGCELWGSYVHGGRRPEVSEVLLGLLRRVPTEAHKSWVVGALCEQWAEEAEPEMKALVVDRETPPQLQELAATTLLVNCNHNQYMPSIVEMILQQQAVRDRCAMYSVVFNPPLRINTSNRNLLILTGFQLLRELPETELHRGSGVALRLGILLDAPNMFEPDHRLRKYWMDDNGNVNHQLLGADWTRNALRWYAENMAEQTPAGDVLKAAPEE